MSASEKMESRMMEVTAYRLFYDNIHDFKTTAMNVESDIRRNGICSDGDDAVPGMKGRTHHDMWVSMKTVSHFNLGTALELMLKLLLFINNKPTQNHHILTKLHDELPENQKQFESTFRQARVFSRTASLIAFFNAASPTSAPPPPPNRDISSLRGFFATDVLWSYSWELGRKWRHSSDKLISLQAITFFGQLRTECDQWVFCSQIYNSLCFG